jgi:hypothetical protein
VFEAKIGFRFSNKAFTNGYCGGVNFSDQLYGQWTCEKIVTKRPHDGQVQSFSWQNEVFVIFPTIFPPKNNEKVISATKYSSLSAN